MFLIRTIIACALLSVVFYIAEGQAQRVYMLPAGVSPGDFSSHTIIVKLKEPAVHNIHDSALYKETISQSIDSEYIVPVFPGNNSSTERSHLSAIYKITLKPGQDLITAINKLLCDTTVLYAEPYFTNMQPLGTHEEVLIPNDPHADPNHEINQDYLAVIKAYEAWHLEKGDENVFIGILDTGFDINHEDLKDNIYINESDPVNGIDDDGNGFVDDFRGFDYADLDNAPTEELGNHGTEVAGLSSAMPENAKGIAGVGFNSPFMPVKIYRSSDGQFRGGYEAIVYAADMGCKVINLSWGAANVFSKYVQDIINYVVLEKDVVVVAAAGNSGQNEDYYPASYQNVLSVGFTDTDDKKAPTATYSYHIDLMAPAQKNFTTDVADEYHFGNPASSLAAPLVAGAAALLRSHYPDYSALQIMELLRVSTDDIYDVPGNHEFKEMLGKGRLNIEKALIANTSPAIRMDSFRYENKFGQYAIAGDTLHIYGVFTNYLNSTQSATVQLSSLSSFVTVQDASFEIGALGTLEYIENEGNPFEVYLHKDLPPDEKLLFRLAYQDGEYVDYQYFEIKSNTRFLHIDNGKLALTVSSNGNLGYDADKHRYGAGLLYQGQKLLDDIGLLFSHGDPERLSNNVVKDFENFIRDQDYTPLDTLKSFENTIAAIDVRSTFTDIVEAPFPIGLVVEQKILAWEAAMHNDYIILEYQLTNVSNNYLDELNVGLFADWNLADFMKNKAGWDDQYSLGFVYNENLYTGIALLSEQPVLYYAIDNKEEIGSLFTRAAKYTFLSDGVAKTQAGNGIEGSDVSHIVGGTLSLHVGEKETLTFALVAGESLSAIRQAFIQAENKYLSYAKNPLSVEITPSPSWFLYPNPTSGELKVKFGNKIPGKMTIFLVNSMGQIVLTRKLNAQEEVTTLNLSGLPPGVYILKITDARYTFTQKIVKSS